MEDDDLFFNDKKRNELMREYTLKSYIPLFCNTVITYYNPPNTNNKITLTIDNRDKTAIMYRDEIIFGVLTELMKYDCYCITTSWFYGDGSYDTTFFWVTPDDLNNIYYDPNKSLYPAKSQYTYDRIKWECYNHFSHFLQSYHPNNKDKQFLLDLRSSPYYGSIIEGLDNILNEFNIKCDKLNVTYGIRAIPIIKTVQPIFDWSNYK